MFRNVRSQQQSRRFNFGLWTSVSKVWIFFLFSLGLKAFFYSQKHACGVQLGTQNGLVLVFVSIQPCEKLATHIRC